MTARSSSGGVRVTQTALGSVTGAQSVAIGTETERWVTATLTGDTTVTVTGLTAGVLLKLFVTQDSTGGRALTVTDGAASVNGPISGNALAASALTVFSPDGSTLVVSGGNTSLTPPVKSSSYTLVSTDAGKTVEFNNASALTVTVPTDANAGFNPGDEVKLVQTGAGTLSVAGAAGTSIQSKSGCRALSSRYGRATLTKRAANSWLLSGDIVAATSFDPTTVTGLTGWWKADALALNDGDAVGTWTDSSSGSHNLTQSTSANKPTFHTGGRNGLPCVTFDGVNDNLTNAAITNNTAARTIIAVAARTGGVGNANLWHLNDNASLVENGSGHWNYFRNEAAGTVDLGASSFTVVTLKYTSTASATPYLRGVAGSAFDPNDIYQSTGTGAFNVGSSATSTNFWTGDICELLVYNAALADVDRAAVENYLIAKWGL